MARDLGPADRRNFDRIKRQVNFTAAPANHVIGRRLRAQSLRTSVQSGAELIYRLPAAKLVEVEDSFGGRAARARILNPPPPPSHLEALMNLAPPGEARRSD